MPLPDNRISYGDVLPPESRGVRMPAGTPLGLGILGAARFNAIRRVIEQYERALRAKEAAILAEAAVASAIARREVGREQLRHLDRLREEEGARIEHAITAANLRRRVELMDLEDQIAERESRRAAARSSRTSEALPTAGSNDVTNEFTAFMDDLRKLPEIAKAVEGAKQEIVRQAGGAENLTDAQRGLCEMFDAMLQSFVSKRAGEAAL
jgi:hypothetical protein